MNKENDLEHSSLKEYLPKSVKVIRQAFGYTQEEISRILGVDRSYISKIENNPGAMNLDYVESIAGICKIRASEIILLAEAQNKLENTKGHIRNTIRRFLIKRFENLASKNKDCAEE